MGTYKHTLAHWFGTLGLTACALLPVQAAAQPVIPGLVGFGSDTPAGRGGTVHRVTNLNASGSGSLKACVDAEGPRVCVFEVSGTIHLTRDLTIDNPHITIAGQTAPSPGITIRGAALWVRNSHVLIQHLRLRAGDDRDGPDPDNRNALRISSGKRSLDHVVIANNSISWGIDQVANVYADNVTLYRNIISEGLHDSLHSKGPHSKGILFREADPFGTPIRATMIGNLFAHNEERNPITSAPRLVFVNNVIYNWGGNATHLRGRSGVVSRTSLVGNYYKAGRDSNPDLAILMRGRGSSADMTPGSSVYVDDNITPRYDGRDPWSAVHIESGLDSSYQASSPPTWHQTLDPLSADQAYDWVLDSAGARPVDRDAVDERVVRDVRQGTGRLIDSVNEAGGWPTLAVNHRALTLPSSPDADPDGNGYTNLEEWLHDMAAQVEGVEAPSPGEDILAPPMAPTNLRGE